MIAFVTSWERNALRRDRGPSIFSSCFFWVDMPDIVKWKSRYAQSNESPAIRFASWVRKWVGEVFSADLRSLAAFRIAMALIVLIDVIGKARSLTAFYTDEGVLPRRVLLAELRPWSVSLNLISGTFFIQAMLFGVATLAALALLVGYRSRLASVVVWVMVVSIQWRNPFLLHGSDELLRVLLFWSMFLPLGARWSVDHWRQRAPLRVSNRFVSIGVAGLFLQIAFMYWFAIILKTGREWRIDGTALYYALSSDQLISPTGTWLLQFPALLKVLTFGTIAIEALAPVLLFSPFRKGPVRTAGVALVMSLHFGILVAMNIGVFPLLSAFCMVCFLPSWFWDTAAPRLRAALPETPRFGRLVELAAAVPGRLRAAPLWGRLATVRRASLGLVSVSAASAPSALADTLHSSSPVPAPDRTSRSDAARAIPLRASVGSNLLAAFFLLYVFVMNITTVTAYTMPLPQYSLPMSVALALDQRWAMYSPYPAKFSYWLTVPGVLRDGRQVDLLQAVSHQDPDRIGQVSWDKPSNVNETYRDISWLRYLTTLGMPTAQERLLNFGGYICRSWNEWYPDGPMQLQTFDIVYFTQPTLPDGERGEVQYQVIWQHRCR